MFKRPKRGMRVVVHCGLTTVSCELCAAVCELYVVADNSASHGMAWHGVAPHHMAWRGTA